MAVSAPPKEYSRVSLSLENCFISEERLRETPSRKDGVSPGLEADLRIVGCEYIQSAGLLLRLPQVTVFALVVLLGFNPFVFARLLWRLPKSCFKGFSIPNHLSSTAYL